jgi:SAM-dependent methyltransferase
MKLTDLIQREIPRPWTEGDNIPWNEPGFSRRMLKEHLTQAHDAASRRTETIERHVRFIHERVLGGRPARVLDLGCGPGLYAQRLACLGHSVDGIDFSPASIEYARQAAAIEGLHCTYTLADVRAAEYGAAYDLVMFIFGEFNVFSPQDARTILRKARAALRVGGTLLLEPSTAESIARIGREETTWYASESGLFSEYPHLVLQQAFWDEETQAATKRHWIIDAASGTVTRFTASYQAYRETELEALLSDCGFESICFYPSLTGEREATGFFALTAEKSARDV